MTRLGWVMLALFLLVGAAFLSMTRFGTAARNPPPVAAAPASDADGRGAPLVVPVAGVARAAITDSWGDARAGGLRAHHGTDIMATHGAPVIAAATGRVEKLFRSHLGGTTAYVRSADGRWIYYYAHLAGYRPGLAEGQVVRAGQQLGFVGDTGDAGPGNYHLHFGMQRMQPGERWYEGEDVNPYPLLAGRAATR